MPAPTALRPALWSLVLALVLPGALIGVGELGRREYTRRTGKPVTSHLAGRMPRYRANLPTSTGPEVLLAAAPASDIASNNLLPTVAVDQGAVPQYPVETGTGETRLASQSWTGSVTDGLLNSIQIAQVDSPEPFEPSAAWTRLDTLPVLPASQSQDSQSHVSQPGGLPPHPEDWHSEHDSRGSVADEPRPQPEVVFEPLSHPTAPSLEDQLVTTRLLEIQQRLGQIEQSQAARQIAAAESTLRLGEQLQSALAQLSRPPVTVVNPTGSGAARSQLAIVPLENQPGYYRIEAREALLAEVIVQLARLCGHNILTPTQLPGTISLELAATTPADALAALLLQSGQQLDQQAGLTRVIPIQETVPAPQPVETRFIRPRYVRAAQLAPLLTPLLSSTGKMGTLAADVPGTTAPEDELSVDDALLITDHPDVLHRIGQVLLAVDVPPPMIEVQAEILLIPSTHDSPAAFTELASSSQTSTTAPPDGVVPMTLWNMASLRGQAGDAIAQLKHRRRVSSLGSPRVQVLNRQVAALQVGSLLMNTAGMLAHENLSQGVSLFVRPQVNADGMIRLSVEPERRVTTGGTHRNAATVHSAGVSTQLLVADGETVLVGGVTLTGNPAPSTTGARRWSWRKLGTRNAEHSRETAISYELIILLTPRVVANWTTAPGEHVMGEHATGEQVTGEQLDHPNAVPLPDQSPIMPEVSALPPAPVPGMP